ncbi:DUF1360 domain-containing protein [Streptomyces arboris]|uniref:DUF1360 domain-containing protein n=1 Tax=Streptomyces arboris TaxID=2600619 RepID=UPI003BF5C133
MISFAELALLSFAGYRGTQLAVHDSILDPVRDKLVAWHDAANTKALRTALITLISCTYCMGWWVSGAALAVWLVATGQWHDAPLLVHAVTWVAVAGGQSLLNRWDDTLGRPA